MESVGARLKQIRLEKGLSLEEVHKQTKIHLNVLKAIEEDSFIGMSPIYIKGFLKIYCDFLGVDTKGIISEFQKSHQTPEQAPLVKQKDPIVTKRAGAVLPSWLSGLKSLKFFRIKKQYLVFAAFVFAGIILVTVLVKFIHAGITHWHARRAQARVSQPVVRPVVKVPTTRTSKQAVSPRVAAPQEIAQGIRVSLRAKEDCWLRLYLDGKLVFQRILKRGKSETWQAKEKIEFSAGNATALLVEVNGKTLPPLGRRGEVLKKVVITKDGGVDISR
jgi:cytoskeletal protein RodZ